MDRIDQDIKNHTFAKVYLIYGEESYLKDISRNKLRHALIADDDSINLNIYDDNRITEDEVISQAQTLPFFSEYRLIIVSGSGWFKKGGKDIAKALPSFPDETVLVFIEDEVDKKSKLYSAVKSQGVIVEYNTPKAAALYQWIAVGFSHYGKKITRSATEMLVEYAGISMQNLYHEIQKLVSYVGERDAVYPEDIQAITSINYTYIENRIFQMINAAAGKRKEDALAIYHELIHVQHRAPSSILSTFTRQITMILQVKELRLQGFDQPSIIEKTGYRDFQVRNALQFAGNFSLQQLKNILAQCARSEEDFKTGRMEDVMAVELIILTVSI